MAQRVTRILTVGRTHALGAVDHGEDTSRLKQDGIRRTRRRENVNAGGPVRTGEGVDLRIDAVHTLFLGRGRGFVGGIRGFGGVGGIGRISVVRCYTVLGSSRGDDARVRI